MRRDLCRCLPLFALLEVAPACGESRTLDGGGDVTASSQGTGTTTPGDAEDGGEASASASSTAGDGDDSETSSSGSSSGSSDSSSDSGGSGPGPDADCLSDEDCQLFDDCCGCMPLHVDDPIPPGCPSDCDQAYCAGFGVTAAVCAGGVCDYARATCDPLAATCDGIPPSCPPGTTPGIVGECFNGLCVPLDLCDVVPDCEVCGPDQICLRLERLQGPAYTCRPRPSWCGETVDCACAASLCGPTYPLCEDLAPGQLSCSCEDC